MQQLGAWVVRLTVAAIVCAVVCVLAEDRPAKGAVRMVCGVFLTVTILQPLTDLSLPDPERLVQPYLAEGMEAAALGESWAAEERLERIKLGLETYILDKAAALGAAPEVSVSVDEQGNPVSTEITGSLSGKIRRELSAVIEKDLGVSREDQKWTS